MYPLSIKLITISAGRNPAESEANQLSTKQGNAENDLMCTFKFQRSPSQDDGTAADKQQLLMI